ncbi:calcium/sodium antiporter [Cerasicoccus frondis]|uniref:calcium/sodium antiporter n=1 Tax=Cerasicoccus frondis TaxID=490090 RepID=UPI002852813F|nr:calcium/sodium antiporter [Cerasicoccus frondis]
MIPYETFDTFLLAFILLIGLGLLCVGGDWLAKGAASLALILKINPVIVGLTIVSISTSMPEMITAFIAAAGGNSGLAVGNIVGSNLGNAGLILGVAALIYPITIQNRLVKQEVPLLLIVTVMFTLMSMGGFLAAGEIGRVEGLLLLAGTAGYLFFMVSQARRSGPAEEGEISDELADELKDPLESVGKCAMFILVGSLFLALGAEMLVGSAVEIATRIGVNEVLIGLTLVALGTSLPELAASIAAALRRQSDIIAGNIVGSNIFNMLLIGGSVSTFFPLQVERRLFVIEFPSMVLLTLLLWFAFYTERKVTRMEGAFLVVLYFVIIGLSSASQMGKILPGI